jgi:hypothetical protein
MSEPKRPYTASGVLTRAYTPPYIGVMTPVATHRAEIERGVGSTSYGFRCSCGHFSGYGMRERHARAAMLKHIGHVLTVTPVREPGFGGTGGWAYLPTCSCGIDRGDPVDHRMSATIWHEDHLREVNS